MGHHVAGVSLNTCKGLRPKRVKEAEPTEVETGLVVHYPPVVPRSAVFIKHGQVDPVEAS